MDSLLHRALWQQRQKRLDVQKYVLKICIYLSTLNFKVKSRVFNLSIMSILSGKLRIQRFYKLAMTS